MCRLHTHCTLNVCMVCHLDLIRRFLATKIIQLFIVFFPHTKRRTQHTRFGSIQFGWAWFACSLYFICDVLYLLFFFFILPPFAHRNNLVSILTMEIIQFHAVDAFDCDLQAENIQHSVS